MQPWAANFRNDSSGRGFLQSACRGVPQSARRATGLFHAFSEFSAQVAREALERGDLTVPLWQTTQLRGIHTIIRDKACERSDFVFQSDRLIRMVVEEALSLLPTEPRSVTTPTGVSYDGLRFGSKLCAVSIPRSGDTMEQGVRQVRREERRSRWSEGVVFDSNVRGIGDSRCADWQDFDSARRAHGQARVAVLEAAA